MQYLSIFDGNSSTLILFFPKMLSTLDFPHSFSGISLYKQP